MRMKIPKITGFLLTLGIFFFIINTFIYSVEASQQNSIQIPLVYPQKSNAPKGEVKRIEEPAVVMNEVFINVIGINPEQLKHPNLYVEYFLDDNLVYSTQDKKQDGLKEDSSRFILDTRLYPNGRHSLVANLWDEDGPSAIGIRQIIIQNQNED